MKINPNKSNMNNSIKSKIRVLKYTTLLVLFFFYHTGLNAQNSRTTSNTIQLLDNYLNSGNRGDKSVMRLKDLVYETKPSIYFYGGTEKTYGNNPECLFTDVAGFNLLSNQNLSKNDIELITIRIEKSQDLQNNIDLSNADKFPNLKYIYILTTFESDINNVARVIIHNSNRYTLVFKSQIGS